jgi:chemotaxis protein CheZ
MPDGRPGAERRAAVAARLAQLSERRGAASAEQVTLVVETVLSTMQGDLTQAEASLLSEVEQIGRTITAAKQEIAALRVADINGSFIPSATDELDAIVEATARATNEILDACETFEAVSAELGGEAAARLQAAATRIYEACSFQDITGQRITKVVSTLKSIEDRISAIIDAFGERYLPGTKDLPRAAAPQRGEAALLNGPQLPGNGVDQAEIDRLLASLD